VDGTTDCPVLALPTKRPTFQGWLTRQSVRLPRAGSVDKTADCPGLAQPTQRQTSQDIRSVNPFFAGGCLLEISEQEFYVVFYQLG